MAPESVSDGSQNDDLLKQRNSSSDGKKEKKTASDQDLQAVATDEEEEISAKEEEPEGKRKKKRKKKKKKAAKGNEVEDQPDNTARPISELSKDMKEEVKSKSENTYDVASNPELQEDGRQETWIRDIKTKVKDKQEKSELLNKLTIKAAKQDDNGTN